MKIERTKNAKRNSIWGLIGRITGLLLPFFSRTVIIKILGAEYLGLSGLFTSVLTVLNLTELGVGSAIVYSMYKPIAMNDEELVCALLNTYKKVYRIIGIIILVMGMIIMPFIKYIISGEIPEDINLYILYFLYLLNTAVSYLLFAYKNSLLHAHQRDDITSKIGIATNVLLNFVQIIVLLVSENYYWFIILQILFTIINNVINACCVSRMFPQYTCRGNISKEMSAELKKKITGLMMIKISQVSRNSLDSIIISAFLGLQTVAIYNNYYYIISAVTSILLVTMNAISAGVGNSIAIETKEKNMRDLKIINFLYMTISGGCAACILCLCQPFMEIWVGEELMFSNPLMWLLVLQFIVMKIGDVQAQYFDAAGLWWHGRWRGAIEASSNLVLNIIFGYYLGAVGIVLATIVTIVLIDFPLASFYTFRYYFGFGLKEYMLEQIKIVLKILIACIVCYAATYCLPSGTVMSHKLVILVIKGGASCLLFVCTFFALNFRDKKFKEALSWIKAKI